MKRMDLTNFNRVYDLMGEDTAKEFFFMIQNGEMDEEILEYQIYEDITKEEYLADLRERFSILEKIHKRRSHE